MHCFQSRHPLTKRECLCKALTKLYCDQWLHVGSCHTGSQRRRQESRSCVMATTGNPQSAGPPIWPKPAQTLKKPRMPTPQELEKLRQTPISQPEQPSNSSQPSSLNQAILPLQQSTPTVAPPSSSTKTIPTRILAVDYGSKWTGVALGIDGRTEELQVMKVDRDNRPAFVREILALAMQHQAQGIVIGVPLDPHNAKSTLTNTAADSPHATKCRWFAHAVAMIAQPRGVQVFLYDESGTSGEALRMVGLTGHASLTGMRSTSERLSKKVDSLSAALLAKRFMDQPGAAVRVVVKNASDVQ